MSRSDPDELKKHVEYLCGIQPPRNYMNLGSLAVCQDYISARLEELGYTPERQPFRAGGREYANIHCQLGPEDGKYIVAGAHYDVDNNTPGADDNASGIAGLLELARLLKEKEASLTNRYELVFFSMEESPFFRTNDMGSYHHARRLKERGTRLHAMVCLEMIGYFSSEKGSQRYPVPQLNEIYPDTADFIGVVGKQGQEWLVDFVTRCMKETGEIKVESISAPPGINEMIALSDHISYWKNGFDAVMISDTSFYRNPNYHRSSDRPETLDYPKMAAVVNGVLNALLKF